MVAVSNTNRGQTLIGDLLPGTDHPAMIQASLAKRFLNFVLDGAFLCSMVLGFVFFLNQMVWLADVLFFFRGFFPTWLDPILLIVGFPLCFIYYLAFEYGFGRTPAKWMTHTKVVSKSACLPTFRQILVRTLFRFLPIDFLFFFGFDSRGLHDRWSRTWVIDVG